MAGQIKSMLDSIIVKRSKGNKDIENLTVAKLALKGLNPGNFNNETEDVPETIEKVKLVASELGVSI